ncbi:hypothetical protein ILT44_15005 [Microvirga sp. BT689]|uniref:hypothetical protein n=1 Tax=Microvirga arvi TaxID=2778731 RepID=UPI00194F5D71|nr:hypothetical protein [Microvirga arvi]MBM6581503.1 hypothetical protein [Microvirga arvi]
MTANVEHSHGPDVPSPELVYAPDILPRLQFLLAALADIDVVHERSLETIKNTPADDNRKDEIISALRRAHREQRSSYVQELLALRERMDTAFH